MIGTSGVASAGWPMTVAQRPEGTTFLPALLLPVTWELASDTLSVTVQEVPPAINPAWIRHVCRRTAWTEATLSAYLLGEERGCRVRRDRPAPRACAGEPRRFLPAPGRTRRRGRMQGRGHPQCRRAVPARRLGLHPADGAGSRHARRLVRRRSARHRPVGSARSANRQRSRNLLRWSVQSPCRIPSVGGGVGTRAADHRDSGAARNRQEPDDRGPCRLGHRGWQERDLRLAQPSGARRGRGAGRGASFPACPSSRAGATRTGRATPAWRTPSSRSRRAGSSLPTRSVARRGCVRSCSPRPTRPPAPARKPRHGSGSTWSCPNSSTVRRRFRDSEPTAGPARRSVAARLLAALARLFRREDRGSRQARLARRPRRPDRPTAP